MTAVSFLGLPSLPENPADLIGWSAYDTIRVQVTFSEPVNVTGVPRLVLGIGVENRFAAYREERSAGAFVVFAYVIAPDDRDEDGVSVEGDALELNGGTIRNAAGLDADIDLGPYAVQNDPSQVVVAPPPQRVCADERELVMYFSPVIVSEWDGTPIRVDMIRNFPDFVTDADLLELLAPVGTLADQIEAQLGYPILKMGGLVPVPPDAPPGWDKDWRRIEDNGALPREPGTILAFYLDDYAPREWDGSGLGVPASSHSRWAYVSYNKRFLGPFWFGNDACCQGRSPNSREGAIIIHDLFHLFGWVHDDQTHYLERGQGVPMSGILTRGDDSVYRAVWPDIDLLRCIFPERG